MATVNLGNIKLNWKGAYNASTAYVIDDVVSYNGSSYVCIAATTGNLPTVTAKWNLMAEGGDVATTLTTQGDVLYRDGSGLQRLGAGTSGYFLKTQGTGANPVWAEVGGTIKEAFYQNYAGQNTSASSNYFSFSFTPTQSGQAFIMYTINYRMASASHMYVRTDFDNGTTNVNGVREDGFNYASSASAHNQAGTVTALPANQVTAGTQCTVRAVNNGGDTANSSGDGVYEYNVMVFII
jgi:hypothetical protein